ncbi:MAG: tRNA (adenosine(37)-N6)-dimethylallyltransferase MiaA [Phycisphaerales bacterium]|nr:tRNA (adenosine(37)-N6)-dimethylallyltransferase MiaA [Phycisphaerales bacterium]
MAFNVANPPHPLGLVIYGPTASGKSALGLELARRLDGEIVTVDSLQVYRGMDIGTAKPSGGERAEVTHHLIDIADPHADEPFTVENWLKAAEGASGAIRARGKRPIFVGGTSLYVQSLMYGLFEGPAANEEIRRELDELSDEALAEMLRRTDPKAAMRIHPSDRRRSIRAIEVFRLTGTTISELQTQWSGRPARDDVKLVVLMRETDELNRRINARVKGMMSEGLLEEVRGLVEKGPLNRQAREGLGYKQLLAHLENPKRVPLNDAVEKIKIETRRFAKNQRTWMKRMAGLGADHAKVVDATGKEPGALLKATLAALGES